MERSRIFIDYVIVLQDARERYDKNRKYFLEQFKNTLNP
jgi:hypothetical protein